MRIYYLVVTLLFQLGRHMMKKIFKQENERKETLMKKKQDEKNRAYKASERLYKGKEFIEAQFIYGKAERLLTDTKINKIDRIKYIYMNEDCEYYSQARYERASLIKNVIDEVKPQRREKSKLKKDKKKTNSNVTYYGKVK